MKSLPGLIPMALLVYPAIGVRSDNDFISRRFKIRLINIHT